MITPDWGEDRLVKLITQVPGWLLYGSCDHCKESGSCKTAASSLARLIPASGWVRCQNPERKVTHDLPVACSVRMRVDLVGL